MNNNPQKKKKKKKQAHVANIFLVENFFELPFQGEL